MRKSKGSVEVILTGDLHARVQKVREARAVGDELPALSAVLREAVRLGLPHLETANPSPPIAA
jgi:hypothetical protein